MSLARDLVVDALLWAGCLVAVLASCALLWTRPAYDAVHLLAPANSLAAPLIAVALIVRNGATLTSALIAVITVLLVVTGPAMGMAAARTLAEREGRTEREEPE